MNRIRRLCFLLTLAMLTGCSTYQRPYQSSSPPPKKPYQPPPATTQPAKPPPKVYIPKPASIHERPAEASPPAVIALMDAAESERRSGQLDAAVATLERAIKIQPRNAKLWHDMAALRLEQYKPRLALDLARKSNTLASGERELKRNNWRIISECKHLLGDPDGAARALEEADR